MLILCKSCHSMFRLDSSLIKPSGSRVRCSKCQTVFKAYRRKVADRRKHQRIKTQNLISHFSFDELGKLDSQGIGKAIDISKGGILIETLHPIESDSISLMAVDLENNLIEIKGRLMHLKKSPAGTYLSGIEFVDNDKQVINFIIKLVKVYNHRKSNLFIRWRNSKPQHNSKPVASTADLISRG